MAEKKSKQFSFLADSFSPPKILDSGGPIRSLQLEKGLEEMHKSGNHSRLSSTQIFQKFMREEYWPQQKNKRKKLTEMGILLTGSEEKQKLRTQTWPIENIILNATGAGKIIDERGINGETVPDILAALEKTREILQPGTPESYEIERIKAKFRTWLSNKRREEEKK